MATTNEAIGKRITEARENFGITRKELAEKVGVAASTITRYEKGTIENIKMPVIEAISRALQVNPMWVIGKSDCRSVEEMTEKEESYYSNPETAEMAEQLRSNAGLRMLFKASADLPPEKMQEAYNYVQYLKSKEPK